MEIEILDEDVFGTVVPRVKNKTDTAITGLVRWIVEVKNVSARPALI